MKHPKIISDKNAEEQFDYSDAKVVGKRIEELVAQVARLKLDSADQSDLGKNLSRRLSLEATRGGKHDRLLRFIDQNAVIKMINAAENDAKELRKRFHLLILRQTVVTEINAVLCQLTPEISDRLRLAAILMIDQPDDWWKDREDFTLAQWRQEAMLIKQPVVAPFRWG